MSVISYDLHHLTVFDSTHYTKDQCQNEALLQHANELFVQFYHQILPVASNLPKETVLLPREKPIPVEKPKTRFEEFKKEKGLKFQKKERLVIDKLTGEWKPRYGYGKANNSDDEWLMEVPNHSEDPFAKRDAEKKERIKEQLKRERRNQKRIARATAELSSASVSTKGKKTKNQISKAIDLSTNPGSSASMNQFNKLEKKPPIFENGSKIPKHFDRTKGQKK